MSAETGLGRRHFLLGFGAAAATVAAQPWNIVSFVAEPIETHLAALLPASESTLRVGSAYLRSSPHEADIGILARLVQQTLGAESHTSPPELAQLAVRAIATDFRARRVVRVDGWVMAPTEARLAALCTLVHADARTT